MKLQTYLTRVREDVNAGLIKYFDRGEPLLSMLRESIDYTLYSGGKRVRPAFVFMVGSIFGVPKKELLSSACAVEMIHTASLIMDDLPIMDNSTLRRGKATNHQVYGQATALLAGIALLCKASHVVLEDETLPHKKRSAIAAQLARAAGIDGMAGGQFIDLISKFQEGVGYETLKFIHTKKTASLFITAGRIGAILGNAGPKDTSAIVSYAEHLGYAFQILDDLLDIQGTGKELGKDTRKDKINFSTLFGPGKARAMVKKETGAAIRAISRFSGRNTRLVELAEFLLNRHS